MLKACTAVRSGFEQLSYGQREGVSDKEILLDVVEKASSVKAELNSHATALQSLASNATPYGIAATACL